MELTVNPTRMELMRMRRRLGLATRGHKLLKDKQEELMRRFLEILRRLSTLQDQVKLKWEKTLTSFALVRAKSSGRDLETLIPEGTLNITAGRQRMLNTVIPRFEIAAIEVSEYDLLNTESELDIGIKKGRELIADMLEVATLWNAVELLAREIEGTRRRVNALEHVLIPSIKEAIRSIANRLEEMERSFQIQLLRVKEHIRGL
jgi:V/A-type H+-transporting ATPase subunit D